jgi:hypothetical protein
LRELSRQALAERAQGCGISSSTVKKQNQLCSRQRRLLNHMGVLSHGFVIFWNRKVAIL